jgi:hypothetical protein
MLGRLDIIPLAQPGQAMGPRINEGEALRVTIRALNSNLGATTPLTMRYRIQDVDQNSTLLDWTTLTPATSVDVTITGAQNSIRNGRSLEHRQILAEASDIDGVIRKTLNYTVADIEGIE